MSVRADKESPWKVGRRAKGKAQQNNGTWLLAYVSLPTNEQLVETVKPDALMMFKHL